MIAWLLGCALKAALLLAAAWLGATALRRGSAATRHQIWMVGVVGALAVPVACWLVPAVMPRSVELGPALAVPAVTITPGAPVTSAAAAWPTWLAIAWAAGALAVAIRIARGHLAAHRLVRTATGFSGDVATRVLQSDAIGSPLTVGVIRPRVVLPAAAAAWSPERLRAVLLHELGHVARRDTLVQLAAQLACALYWWNPLAWLAAARLRREREHACDDRVLGAGVRPSSYASDLLELARAGSIPAAAIGMVEGTLEARLTRILDAGTPRRSRLATRIAVLALAGSAVAAIGCTASAPPEAAAAPAPRGTLAIGAPSVRAANRVIQFDVDPATYRGDVDLERVSAELDRRVATLARCYERRLAAQPALAGTVTIHWVIESTGHVPESCITGDTVGDPEIVDCVNELVLRGGPFPAPRTGSVDVEVPFVFRPASAS